MNTLNQTTQDEVLKATALLYLQDALAREAYETCKDLISLAKGFGAEQSEISEILADYLKTLKTKYTGQKTKSRLG